MFLLFFSLMFPHPSIAIEPFEEAERKGHRDPFALDLESSQDSLSLSELANTADSFGAGASVGLWIPSVQFPWL